MNLISYIKKKSNLSSTKVKVISNIYWAVLGKCVNLFGSLLVGIMVARYLGQEQYGLMNYVISFVAIFQVIADFGLDSIQIREEAKNSGIRDKLIGTTFVMKLIFAAIALILITIYTLIFEADTQAKSLIFLYAISIILNTSWVVRNHFTSIVWNEYIVKTEISRTIIGMLVKGILLLCHASLVWFVCSLVIDSILLASGYLLSYSKKIDTVCKWSFDKKMALFLLKQSFPLLLSGTAIVVYHRIDQVMIGNMMDKSYVRIYSVAVRIVEVLIFVPTIISQTVSPILVRAKQEDIERYKQYSSIFMNVTVWLCIIMAVALSLVSYPLVAITFGSQYISAVSVLSIMSFKVIGDALSQTSGQLIIIEGKQKYVSIRNFIGCIVCVLLNLLLIGKYGVYGAAVVSIITILSSGTIANLIIPTYRQIFKQQMVSLLLGWKDFANIKTILK